MAHILISIIMIIGCVLDLNEANQANAWITLPQQDVFSLFTEYELWGMKPVEFGNKTQDVVQVNVVIDDMRIDELKTDKNVMRFDMIYPDIQPIVERERMRLNNRTKWTSSMKPDIFFREYRDWIEYEIFIEYLLLEYPDIVSRDYMGQTVQGRNIPILTLSGEGGTANKPSLYIQATVHAREWLANAATMYILNALLEGYKNNDAVITEILNNINIYIAPTINIDGYIYSWEVDRNWRKNRRNNGAGVFGVDLNRNYDGPIGTWCTVGSSSNPSSNSYCGPSPYSEPEVEAIQSFIFGGADIYDNPHNIYASVDMHTFGWYILRPYGYNWDAPLPQPELDQYIAVGQDISDAIYNVHGVRYTSTNRFGPTSGTMRDYPFSISLEQNFANKIFSFTWEGRGSGFDISPDNIIPAGQEQLQGMLALAQFVMSRDSHKK